MKLAGIVLFAFANVLGPWLCCCTPERLLGSQPEKIVCRTEVPSCPHCKEARKAISSSGKPEPKAPAKAPAKPCPCQSNPPVEIIAADVKDSRYAMFVLLLPQFESGGVIETTVISSTSAAVQASELPFLSTEERLFVHHCLLC